LDGFGFEWFRPYLIRSHVVVFIDLATLKHFLRKRIPNLGLNRRIMLL